MADIDCSPVPTPATIRQDLTGRLFGRWIVLGYCRAIRTNSGCIDNRWLCKCSCGTVKSVSRSSLMSGHSNSCGCFRKEWTSTRKRTHGCSKHELFSTWWMMIRRCTNPQNSAFDSYGGRGITVCDRWRFGEDGKSGVECFIEDVGERPANHSLDRRDNNLGYCPENCRWATIFTQRNNTRSNICITLNGTTKTLAEWSRDVGIHRASLLSRLKTGWSIENTLTVPLKGSKSGTKGCVKT